MTHTVVVVGMGAVGGPLAELAASVGHRVLGLDPRAKRVSVPCTDDPAVLGEASLIVVCVPTPLKRNGRPDIGPLRSALSDIAQHGRPDVRVIIESTIDPGTLATSVPHWLGLPLEQIAHAPERIDPGSVGRGVDRVPRVVGGFGACPAWARAFYASLGVVVHPATAAVAAYAKMLENTFRLVNVALVGEFADLCAEDGVDISDVVAAAATKPFGFMSFSPGPGAGGHCIAVDPVWLLDHASRIGVQLGLVHAAVQSNASRATAITSCILRHTGRPSPAVLVLGAAYKRNVADTRDSAALRVIEGLRARGATVFVHDPVCAEHIVHHELCDIDLGAIDVVAVLVDHERNDYGALAVYSGPVVDCCGASRSRRVPGRIFRY